MDSHSRYHAIRARLDNPQVVVWDPCAVTLAPDDPAWPGPIETRGNWQGELAGLEFQPESGPVVG